MFLCVALVLTGVWASHVAAKKGRGPVRWFCIGFFGGLIGVGVAYVVDDLNQPSLTGGPATESTHKKCPHCAELVRREAIKCRYCNESLAS